MTHLVWIVVKILMIVVAFGALLYAAYTLFSILLLVLFVKVVLPRIKKALLG